MVIFQNESRICTDDFILTVFDEHPSVAKSLSYYFVTDVVVCADNLVSFCEENSETVLLPLDCFSKLMKTGATPATSASCIQRPLTPPKPSESTTLSPMTATNQFLGSLERHRVFRV